MISNAVSKANKFDSEQFILQNVSTKCVNADSTSPKSKERPCNVRYVRSFSRDYKQMNHIPLYCYVCRIQCKNDERFVKHMETHGRAFVFIRQVDDYILEKPMFLVRLDYRPDYAKTMVYVRNVSPHSVLRLIRAYLHLEDGRLKMLIESEMRLPWGTISKFCFDSCLLSELNRSFGLILVGLADSETEILELYHLQVTELSHFVKEQLVLKKPTIRCQPLNQYPVPDLIKHLYKHDFSSKSKFAGAKQLLDQLDKFKETGLNKENYIQYLKVLNQIEDFDIQMEYTKYRIEKAKLVPGISEKYYRLSIDQFETAPTLLNDDCMVKIIIPSEFEPRSFLGTIHEINPDYMLIHANTILEPSPIYTVVFECSRLLFKLEYYALSLMKDIDFEKTVFPKPPMEKKVKYDSFQWFNKYVATNNEQRSAVQNIVNRTSFPAPYVLFGPPGTGKTSTIVEAVLQIWKLQPKTNVLVSASSNFACDEFTTRLLEFIPATDVFRFLSKACERNIDNINEAIIDISNLSSGTYTIPTWHDIYNSRIVVTTITMCGRLAQAKIDPHHFSYIFIDEAGSAKEVSTLIPIICIGTNKEEAIANVILSGDPKQLGPLVRHEYLQDTVQGISMLERLMNHGIYMKDTITGKYNSLVITKLLDNYRSHQRMLEFSNYAFYDGELRARGSEFATQWAIGWSELPRGRTPFFFHALRGQTEKDAHSCSLYNRNEAEQIILYIKLILSGKINGRTIRQSDIGVISPYTKQVQYIKNMVNNNDWDQLEVGTTEQYQGREKSVILISTVRSGTSSVGFLCNEKRLNVAITRARGLMIIVGNPDTLQKDVYWYSLLKLCVDYGSFKGEEFELIPPYMQFKRDVYQGSTRNMTL